MQTVAGALTQVETKLVDIISSHCTVRVISHILRSIYRPTVRVLASVALMLFDWVT